MNHKKLILFLASLTPLIFLPYLRNTFYVPKIVWIFLITILISTVCIKYKLFGYRNTFIIPIGLITFWYLISLNRCVNIFEGIYAVLIFILFITFYISLEDLVSKDVAVIDIFIGYLVLVSFMVSLYGILQICGIDFLRWEVERTALSTLGRRNFAGEYLVMVIPYVYYLLYKEKKWYLYIVLLFLISHLVFTFTRASYIAFFVSSVVFFILVSKRISLNKKAIIFLCILLFSYNAFSDIKTFEKGTVKSRFLIWSITLKMIKSNPLMGVGPGNFFVMYPYYAIGEEKALRGISLVVDRAHNDYLDICAETGITGIFLFLYLLYCFFKVCIILYRDIDRKRKLLIAGIISSVVAMCINALASFPFNNPATLFLFWTNVSFAGGIYRKVKGERSVKVSYSIVKFYLVIFAITGIVLSYRGIKAGRCAFLAKVFKGKQSLQFAESAVAYNPFSFKYLHFAGTTALNLGEYQKAYELLTKGINLHPYYDSTHNNLGLIYLFIGDIEKAESSFFTALKLNPDNYEFNNNIGFLYLTTKDYEKAINYLTKAIQLKPDAYLSFYSLGVAYYMKKQYSEAKEQFRKVLEINPDFYPAKEYLEKISR